MMIPKSRPQQSKEKSLAMVIRAGIEDRVVLIGIRGYYSETFQPSGNQRSVYDDAIILLSPSVHATFNANTDPSVYKKGIAVLKTGVHRYRKGNHGISKPGGGYPALRPANAKEELPVTRDGEGDSMGIAINIHKGGYSTTSSLGCQTIYPPQWDGFINLVYSEMNLYNQKTIPYLLVENT
jgi:lysozyme